MRCPSIHESLSTEPSSVVSFPHYPRCDAPRTQQQHGEPLPFFENTNSASLEQPFLCSPHEIEHKSWCRSGWNGKVFATGRIGLDKTINPYPPLLHADENGNAPPPTDNPSSVNIEASTHYLPRPIEPRGKAPPYLIMTRRRCTARYVAQSRSPQMVGQFVTRKRVRTPIRLTTLHITPVP